MSHIPPWMKASDCPFRVVTHSVTVEILNRGMIRGEIVVAHLVCGHSYRMPSARVYKKMRCPKCHQKKFESGGGGLIRRIGT